MKYLLNIFAALAFIVGMASCNQPSEKKDALYASDAFTVKSDSVLQGETVAQVVSPTRIKSNYNSPVNEHYSNLVKFKFSINEKDNDLSAGVDRLILISDQKESPTYVFGQEDPYSPEGEAGILPADYEFTFKVDMRPVIDAFEKQGFYEAHDGSKIARDEFKGVYIAGGSLPMTWDWVNLDERGLKLQDDDKDGIFEITLVLNPKVEKEEKEWSLSEDISDMPQYSSEQPLVDALFNMALEEAKLAIEPDSTFRTGAEWAGVWTRDISYSIYLALAYLQPEVTKISLMKKVSRKRIIQDTGSGGSWPVSSDRTVWALAAWEVYKTTGDRDWLKQCFEIIRNTAEDDFQTLRSPQTGMYSGESSFLDWREQSYPKWMSNVDIYVSQNLGTNAVHYQEHVILSKMAKILGEPYETYDEIAAAIKNGMNEYLWMEEQGYYAQYLYGRHHLMPSKRFEALGEALSIIFEIADEERAKSIVAKSPLTEFGATCIYPQIPDIPPYHNNGIWPFVQSYWNLAAAKAGNEKVLNHGLAAIYRPTALFLSNYENMVAETGDYLGTEINSHRMLWSIAGNLAMVHRVFLGMQFGEDRLSFSPVIPKAYGGKRTLSNFNYRNAVLEITVEGYGNEIASVQIDGKDAVEAVIPAATTGQHRVHIKMKNNDFSSQQINLAENKFSLPNPAATLKDNRLSWKAINGAESYNLYHNGTLMDNTTSTSFEVAAEDFAEYMVTAIDSEGVESFGSEPVTYSPKTQIVELENTIAKAEYDYVDFSGSGFIEVSRTKNKDIAIPVTVEESGEYYVDFRYSDGSGPWNTDNKCAIRTLYVEEDFIGAVVLPQRGLDEWSDWSFSNSHKVQLKKGENILRLRFEEWNTNMNIDVNTAMIDYLRVMKVKAGQEL